MNLSKIENIELDGINPKDAPDYADAYIISADYKGREMTEKELDSLNENYSDFVHEQVLNNL